MGGSWGLCWRSWAALGPLLAVLGRSWGRCVRSWAALGAYVGGLGPLLGPMLAVWGRSWGLCGRSGAEKCEEHGYLENVLISRAGARSAAWGSVLSRSWGLCWRSWAALGPYVGGLGLLLIGPYVANKCEGHGYLENVFISRAGAHVGRLGSGSGPKLAVLGRSWGLCWRSWAALGAYVGGLGVSWGLSGRSWA